MRYMNEWFGPEDFLRLMDGQTDRRIFLVEVVAYHDGKDIKTFTTEIEGKIIDQPRGVSGAPSDKIVCLGTNETRTIAEVLDASDEGIAYNGPSVWDTFCKYIGRTTK